MEAYNKDIERTKKGEKKWWFYFLVKILIDIIYYISLIKQAKMGRYYYPDKFMGSDWQVYPISTIIKCFIIPIILLIANIILTFFRN